MLDPWVGIVYCILQAKLLRCREVEWLAQWQYGADLGFKPNLVVPFYIATVKVYDFKQWKPWGYKIRLQEGKSEFMWLQLPFLNFWI